MPDSVLPPSRFGAGYTLGAPPPTVGSPVAPAPVPPAPTPSVAGSPPTWASSNGPISSLALASFVLVLLMGPFIAPLTLPLSLVARRRIAQGGVAGAGLAKAALAMSCIYLAAAAVVVVLMLIVGPVASR